MKVEQEISYSAIHRICLKSGAERVGETAIKELTAILETIGVEIAKNALDYAKHAGRVTLKKEDIALAAKKIRKI